MMADPQQQSQQQPHPLSKIVSLPANLLNLDQIQVADSGGGAGGISNETNSPAKVNGTTTTTRKQIQFNLDEKKKAAETAGLNSNNGQKSGNGVPKLANSSTSASNKIKTTSSLHETLKQLKADEMRKRKSRGSLGDEEKRRKKSKSRIDLKAFNDRLDEIKRNVIIIIIIIVFFTFYYFCRHLLIIK